MNQQPQSLLPQHTIWRWPINLDIYDRIPILTQEEYAELDRKLRRAKIPIRQYTYKILARLMHPIDDVYTYIQAPLEKRPEILRPIFIEMHRRGKSFWGWTEDEWRESICPTGSAFLERYGWNELAHHASHPGHPGRPFLLVLAYLLDVLPNGSELMALGDMTQGAQSVFGKETIALAAQQLMTVLQGWGYQERDQSTFTSCLCYLFLRNRSPYLQDLSSELLEEVEQACTYGFVCKYLFQISRALSALGLIEKPLSDGRGRGKPTMSGTDGSVDHEWLSWCERWLKQSSLQSRRHIYYALLKVGRWLKIVHPEITSPAQWTSELAAEFVAVVHEMKVGEWSDASTQSRKGMYRAGEPLRPAAKDRLLAGMRTFLHDCQIWGWIRMQLNPHRALQTPKSIHNLIGPNPRVIDKDLWAKLLWAAMNLDASDLPRNNKGVLAYPLEMVRAIAVVWCFSALRSDEIWRLRVGCVRWQREDVIVPETGNVLPHDAVCFLDIPVNKTTTAYTKPVHPLVGKRINAWERVRPHEQLHALDRKTNETVPFLFSYRGMRVSKGYINSSLIPLLCKKAGVPEKDSRGAITSHRARATIASMFYNAREPLSIFELKEYLGHKDLSSTQNYLQVDPTKLAEKVVKAGYLERNLATIEVLLDQEAVINGAASRGESWKYYDLGHGWCTNPFWASCVHRMACAKCPFYRPKMETTEQLLEGKANLVRMLEFVKLTEDEKLLVTEGIELHQELIEKLADVPTPTGPTPRELQASQQPKRKAIPLRSVQHSKEQDQGE